MAVAAQPSAAASLVDQLARQQAQLAELHQAFIRQQIAVQSHFVNVTLAPLAGWVSAGAAGAQQHPTTLQQLVAQPIALGTNTDPYQPIEERFRITRSILELLLETKHPFTITTKSDRVLRDLDILVPAAKLGLAAVAISITSLDPKVHRTLEPRAPSAKKRLAAVRALTDAGVPTIVAIAPVVPQITDHELEAIVEASVAHGARGGFYLPVRLPHEVAPLFRAWLDEHYPDRAAKVMATIRSLRGGRDNDPDFYSRMRGSGPWADLLSTRFEIATKRYGLPQARFNLRCDLFEPPPGDQLRLL